MFFQGLSVYLSENLFFLIYASSGWFTVDKASFPKDKTCRNAIGGRSVKKKLEKYAPALVEALRQLGHKEFISTTRIFIDNKKPLYLLEKRTVLHKKI